MIISEYGKYDGLGLADLVRRKEVSPADLVDSAIDAIERLNPQVNCVVQKLRDHAMAEIRSGLPHGPFHGVPFLVKEFGMHFKGMTSSAGSRLAQGFRHEHDTVLMQRCRAAGLVTVGTTTLPEMAFNASTESLLYGPTRNPWNLGYSAGGSSGGAGAAVGSGMVPIAHANDGGGSIRIPAACNGVVGMKTSRGRTPGGPDFGLFLWGLAVEFVETRTVRDSAAMLDAVGSPDDGYFYTALAPKRSFLAAALTPPRPLRVGVIDQLPGTCEIARENRNRLADTCKLLESLGHVCEPLRIDYDSDAFNSSSIRLWATTLGHTMDVFARSTDREIGPDNTEAVTLNVYKFGQSLTAFDLEEAMSQQNVVCRQVASAMRGYDVLLTPGIARDVAKLGELDQNAANLDMQGWWDQIVRNYSAFTPLFNTTGQPAIMLPLWQAASGLPLAMQFVGHPGDEETLYSLAGQLEHALPWATRQPPIYA
ncbi:amidase [Methylibium sp.]|jgi:amidase|uniref:amidase n=1 Tax=Methylibium sp. TaxID=2067992 RepID=UPI003D118EFF